MLMKRLKEAANQTGIKAIAIAGGVAANSGLRQTLQQTAEQLNWKVYIPAFQYCTDNAGMIAIAAHYKFLKQDFTDQSVTPLARMPIQ
jgi:N6-L-threonylcarbamoyladenine synthase